MEQLELNQLEEHQQQQQPLLPPPPVTGQVAYANPPNHSGPMTASGTPAFGVPNPNQPFPTFQHQLAYQQAHHFHHQQQQQHHQQLQMFWANQMQEIDQNNDFKSHNLPLARIKKIMKADEDVRMISAEAPVVFAKACEMFILELTIRSWIHTEENKRRTLQKNDVSAAISRTDVFDFLVDIIPRDELKEEGLGITKATIPMGGSPAETMPYYYVPPPPGALFAAAQHSRPPHMTFMPWLQPQPQLTPSPPSQHQSKDEEEQTE